LAIARRVAGGALQEVQLKSARRVAGECRDDGAYSFGTFCSCVVLSVRDKRVGRTAAV